MRLHASWKCFRHCAKKKRFWDRAVRSYECQSLVCDLGSMLEAGLEVQDSPHQVEAEVGPLIPSATSSSHTTSKRSNTGEDLRRLSSNPSWVRLPEGGTPHQPMVDRASSHQSRVRSPSSQADASSTCENGLIVTSVVRQMNRGRPTPLSMMTKSPGCGIGSRPSRYRANSLPRKRRRFAASRARRHQIGKSRRFFPGLTRSPRDHLWMTLRVENVSVQTALSTDRLLAIRGSFHS